jgi:hypothetical protein
MTQTISHALLGLIRTHGLLDPQQLEELSHTPDLAGELARRGLLTPYQLEELPKGPGAQLTLGPYLLLAKLGQGGMGQVFKARHKKLDRLVAIKIILKDRLDNPAAVKRFHRRSRQPASSITPTSSAPSTPIALAIRTFSSWNTWTGSTWPRCSGNAARCPWPTPASTSARPRWDSSMPTNADWCIGM